MKPATPITPTRGRPARNDAAIYPPGTIHISARAYDRLFAGFPKVRLFYEPLSRRVELEPAKGSAAGAVHITRSTRGHYQIACREIFRQNRITLLETRRFKHLAQHNGRVVFTIPKRALGAA